MRIRRLAVLLALIIAAPAAADAVPKGYTYHDECDDYRLLDEATATWAGNYVYPKDDIEHDYVQLISSRHGLFDGYAGYQDWTFFYSMTQHYGNALIPKLYANTESSDSMEAIDRTVGDGCDLTNMSLGGGPQDEATHSAIVPDQLWK